MPIRRRPRKQAKTDPVMVAGQGLIPGPGDAAFGSGETPTVTAAYVSPDHRHLAVVTQIYNLPRVAWSNSDATLAFVSRGDEAKILDVSSGKSTMSQGKLSTSADIGYRYASASPRGTLLVRLNGPEATDIAFSHG